MSRGSYGGYSFSTKSKAITYYFKELGKKRNYIRKLEKWIELRPNQKKFIVTVGYFMGYGYMDSYHHKMLNGHLEESKRDMISEDNTRYFKLWDYNYHICNLELKLDKQIRLLEFIMDNPQLDNWKDVNNGFKEKEGEDV